MTPGMHAGLVRKIVAHPTYGPAVQAAITRGLSLILDYHTHGEDSGYCVSIRAQVELSLLRLGDAGIEELAHIRGFGRTVEECIPLCTSLAQALREHYGLDQDPEIHLNGHPVPEAGKG